MKPGRPRIWALAGVFAGIACVLVVHLFLLMVEQGSTWVERSYRNRWGFKDVPTRRGSILDRDGRVLAQDEPGFALFLHYRAFRRDHPVGCAVHGANLAMHAAGYGDDLFGFDRRQRGPRQALDSLLAVPSAWLNGVDVPSEYARDLRFYAVSLVVHTTGRSWSKAKRALFEAGPRPGASLADVLGGDTVAQVKAEFERRLTEFESLVTALLASGHEASLWSELEERRVKSRTDPNAEHIERRVYKRLSFELAARVRLLADRHPGWSARPAVARSSGTVPGRADLASLRGVIGGVREYWAEDFGEEDSLAKVDEMLPRALLDDLVPMDPDMSAELSERLYDRARLSVRSYLLSQGRIGHWGLERLLDGELSGRPGLRLVEKDRAAREHGQWSSLETEPGEDCRLTLDLGLQACLERILDRYPEEGDVALALAVIDPVSGDVLALGGRPLAPLDKPPYELQAVNWGRRVGFVGSVAKPFVALEQLDAERHGRVTRSHRGFQDCVAEGFKAGGRKLACTKYGHGAAASDVEDSIAESCNFFYYQAAQALGAEGLLRAFGRAGWVAGDADPRYQREVPGLARLAQGPSRVSNQGILEQKAIGYEVQASALQVARAYAGLATGVLPSLSLLQRDRPGHAVPLDVHPADLERVRDGLRGCVTRGTAHRVEGLQSFEVLAKTGTAEISRRRENNAWLAGYLTRREPTMAFAAVAYKVPDGEHGGEVAGALVSDFLEVVYADPELRNRYMPGAGR